MKLIPDSASHHGIVKLAGEIDLCCVPEIRRKLEAEVSKGISTLLVDLTDVTFMDSSGLSVIIEYWRQMHECGGKLVVAGRRVRFSRCFGLLASISIFHCLRPILRPGRRWIWSRKSWRRRLKAESDIFRS